MRKVLLIIIVLFCCSLGLSAQSSYLPNEWSKYVRTENTLSAAHVLSRYLQFESVTGNELEAGVFLSELAAEQGLHLRVFTYEPDSYNFAASIYPLDSGKPNIIFHHHIDVVPSGCDSLWTHPPFSGAIADGYVWGRGAIDSKSLGVQQLLALSHFVDYAAHYDLPYNFTLLAVSNEEKGGKLGAGLITERFFDELNPVAVYGEGGAGIPGILEGEPETPYFGIEIDQKTSLWLRVKVYDALSGHGSVPREIYPAKQVAQIASSFTGARQPIMVTPSARLMFRNIAMHERGFRRFALRNMNFSKRLLSGKLRSDPFINAVLTNTVSISSIQTSETADNQMGHWATVTFDCRLLPGVTPEEFLHANRKHFGALFDKIEIIDNSPMSPPSELGYFYDVLSNAIMEIYPQAVTGPTLFPAINDNMYFRKKGIPTYGISPIILSRELIESIHYFDERIEIKELELGVEVYKALIRNILEGL